MLVTCGRLIKRSNSGCIITSASELLFPFVETFFLTNVITSPPSLGGGEVTRVKVPDAVDVVEGSPLPLESADAIEE